MGDLLETSYGKSTLNSLKNTENFTDSAIEHIFEGQVNARGKAVGYHYKGIEGTSGNVIPETESSTNNFGIYKAKVEVNGIPKTANGGFSSFYPKSMSPQEVIGSINEAYRNRVYIRGNTYSGLTSSGMEIEMFLDKNGKIISAYPVYYTTHTPPMQNGTPYMPCGTFSASRCFRTSTWSCRSTRIWTAAAPAMASQACSRATGTGQAQRAS